MNPNEFPAAERRIRRLQTLLALAEVSMFLIDLITIMGSSCFLLIRCVLLASTAGVCSSRYGFWRSLSLPLAEAGGLTSKLKSAKH